MEHVRPATRDDLAVVQALLDAAWDEAAGARGAALYREAGPSAGTGHTPPTRAEDHLAPWAPGDRPAMTLLGLYEEAVVGLAAACGEPGGLGQLLGCWVEPEARGVGVGTALVTGLVGWLEGQGCRGIDAAALPGDRSTKQLLEAAGFSARLLVLHRPPG